MYPRNKAACRWTSIPLRASLLPFLTLIKSSRLEVFLMPIVWLSHSFLYNQNNSSDNGWSYYDTQELALDHVSNGQPKRLLSKPSSRMIYAACFSISCFVDVLGSSVEPQKLWFLSLLDVKTKYHLGSQI